MNQKLLAMKPQENLLSKSKKFKVGDKVSLGADFGSKDFVAMN